MDKAKIISKINAYAPTAIYLGFDYPTEDDPSKYTAEELNEFLTELTDYIKENIR
jgi:hypothetical protein